MKSLICILCLCLQIGISEGQDICNGRIIEGICHFLVRDVLRTYDEARAYCERTPNTYVAAISNQVLQASLALYARDNNVDDLWIGARRQDPLWKWDSDGALINAQGCFLDDPSDRDLPQEMPVPNLLPSFCMQACRLGGYLYAGVQNGTLCFCGNSFGRHGTTDGCTTKCSGTTTSVWCGGTNKNFIYLVSGGYSDWMYNQPNKWGGQQACGVLDGSSNFKFADEACTSQHVYICDLPNDALCTGLGYYRRTINRCYYLSSVARDWYTALEDCKAKGGYLIKIDSRQTHDDLKLVLSVNVQEEKQWIGLISGTWAWHNKRQLTYTNWVPDEPKGGRNCAYMSITQSDLFKWKTDHCDERRYFFCQQGIPRDLIATVRPTPRIPTTAQKTTRDSPSPTTNTPPTTSSKVVPTTSKTTTDPVTFEPQRKTSTSRSPSTQGQGSTSPSPTSDGVTPTDPDVGQVLEGGLSAGYIGLIVLGVILLIAIIVIIILCCLYKKQKKGDKVAASECSFDARPYATLPESRSLSESSYTKPNQEVYIPNGNYASTGIFTTQNYISHGYTSDGYTSHGYSNPPSWADSGRSKRSIYIED